MKEWGRRFVNYVANNAYTISLAVSLGMNKTLIENPGLMTHSAIPEDKQAEGGMHPGGVRIAAGLEAAEDIITDLKEAFDKA